MKAAERFDILLRDRFTCQYCGRKAPAVALEIDHIQPKSRGGSNARPNLQVACYDCNRGKRDRVTDIPPSERVERKFKACAGCSDDGGALYEDSEFCAGCYAQENFLCPECMIEGTHYNEDTDERLDYCLNCEAEMRITRYRGKGLLRVFA